MKKIKISSEVLRDLCEGVIKNQRQINFDGADSCIHCGEDLKYKNMYHKKNCLTKKAEKILEMIK